MPESNGFNVSLFQRNNAVKNLMCMASQSIENFWWYENIVFRVLFFNQLCPSKKVKTFDWHTSVLSQLECSVCNLFGQNSYPLPPSSPMAKRSTFPRHCLTKNMAWGTYITDDAPQKIQAWISYRRDFQNRVQNSVRVIGAQWLPLKGRNWLEVYYLFRLIDEGNICRQKLKNNLRGELIISKVRIV